MRSRWSFASGILLCAFVLSVGNTAKEKPAIVLVHGAFQDGPTTWAKVAPGLRAKGYSAVVVNLPGRDGDSADPHALTTEIYREAVLRAIPSGAQPVILVGHSFGGITISNVGQAAPEKIKALVYLSAYLPKDGQSLQSVSEADKDSKLGQDGNFVISPDYKYASVKAEHGADLFANDAKGPIKDAIDKSLIQEPLAPMGNPVSLTPDKFRAVPKFYIETTQDMVVSPALQKQMINGAGVKRVFKISAGHACYITQPDAVTQAILAVAAQ